jgi:Tfp pilus assembly protein PilN
MINLLPPKEKLAGKQRKKLQTAVALALLSFVFLGFLATLLFFISFDMENRIIVQEALLGQKKREADLTKALRLEQGIEEFNRSFPKINAFYQKEPDLVGAVKALSNCVPGQIYLKSLSYQSKGRLVSLSGFSFIRDDLIKFKENIENEKLFEAIIFPVSNWVKPNNIDFFATFKIKDLNNKNGQQ